MYEYPNGHGQQLNLNWIISEIIALHKSIDPDYQAPSFDNTFPYTNLNQLNLDWILKELKTIKDLVPTENPTIIKMVANALVSASYNSAQNYSVDDIVFYDLTDRLYKCIAPVTAGDPFDNTHWQEIYIGEVLTDLIVNGIATTLTSDDVTNLSNVTGATVTQALNALYAAATTQNTNITNLTNYVDSLILVSTGNSADRTAEIQARLLNNKQCILGAGTFYTTGIDLPDGSALFGLGNSSVLKKFGAGTYVINMNKDNLVANLSIDGNDNLPAQIGTNSGILWNGDYNQSHDPDIQPQNGKISNVSIKNCDGGGITCNNTGTKRYNNIVADNVYITNCGVGINIPFYSEYHRFTNIDAWKCNYGCINNGGNNCFANCDFSDSLITGFVIDNSNGDKTNNSHGTAVGCSFNHIANNTGLALSLNGVSNGFTFGNCNIFRGSIEIINSTGVEITDSLIGTAVTITITDSRAILFDDDIFQTAPTVNRTNSPYTYFKNCYSYADGDYIPVSQDIETRVDKNFFVTTNHAYTSLADIQDFISDRAIGDAVILRVAAAAASAFFESGTSKPTLLYMLKGGATNAYFLALTQGEASIGNFLITTPAVSILHDLAINSDVTAVSNNVTTVDNKVSAIQTIINSIEVRNVTYTYTVTPNTNTSTNLKTLIDADLPAGYEYLGISGVSSGDANVIPYTFRYYNSAYSLALKNVGSTAVVDATATVSYLCIKR